MPQQFDGFVAIGSHSWRLPLGYGSVNEDKDIRDVVQSLLLVEVLQKCHHGDIDLCLNVESSSWWNGITDSAIVSDGIDALLDFLHLIAPRWRNVSIASSWLGGLFLKRWNQHAENIPILPRLLSLALRPPSDLYPAGIVQKAHNLKALAVRATGLPMEDFEFLANLNSLFMDIRSYDSVHELEAWLHNLLSNVESLQVLGLVCNQDTFGTQYDPNSSFPPIPICNFRTRSLVLDLVGPPLFHYMVYRWLPISLVKKLRIKTSDANSTTIQAPAIDLRDSKNLRELDLTITPLKLRWLWQSMDFSSLKSLHLRMTSDNGSPDLASGAAFLLPKLKLLKLVSEGERPTLLAPLMCLDAPSLERLDITLDAKAFASEQDKLEFAHQYPSFPSLKHLGLLFCKLLNAGDFTSFVGTWHTPALESLCLKGTFLNGGFDSWNGME